MKRTGAAKPLFEAEGWLGTELGYPSIVPLDSVLTTVTAVDAVYGLETGPPACGRFGPTPPAAAGPMGMLWGGRGLSATNSPLNLPYRGGSNVYYFVAYRR